MGIFLQWKQHILWAGLANNYIMKFICGNICMIKPSEITKHKVNLNMQIIKTLFFFQQIEVLWTN